jgi:hypothetical protein
MVRIADTAPAPQLVAGIAWEGGVDAGNIRTVSAAWPPIFRPLIGDDKEDIMRVAREIGTYAISILADQDCCSLFVPKHPETMSNLEQVERAESGLDIPRLVQSAMSAVTRETVVPDFSFSVSSHKYAQPSCQRQS